MCQISLINYEKKKKSMCVCQPLLLLLFLQSGIWPPTAVLVVEAPRQAVWPAGQRQWDCAPQCAQGM